MQHGFGHLIFSLFLECTSLKGSLIPYKAGNFSEKISKILDPPTRSDKQIGLFQIKYFDRGFRQHYEPAACPYYFPNQRRKLNRGQYIPDLSAGKVLWKFLWIT